MMSNKVYDVMKWIAMYLIPAVGTLTAVDTFLGVILGISTAKYNKQSEEYIEE